MILVVLGSVAVGIAGICVYIAFGNHLFTGLSPPFTRKFYGGKGYSKKEIPDLSGKRYLITGANTGIGFSTAKHLFENNADVVIACRNTKKGKAAKEELESKFPKSSGTVQVLALDLSSLESVRDFSDLFLITFDKINGVIFNAGIAVPSGETDQEIEKIFGVNHVGHFYLWKLLAPLIKHTANASNEPVTITVLTSCVHSLASEEDLPMFKGWEGAKAKEIEASVQYKNMNKKQLYSLSKAANLLFSNYLAAKYLASEENVLVNAVHPGAVLSQMFDHFKFARDYKKYLADTLMFTPDTSSLTSVYVSVSDEVVQGKITGKYFVPLGVQLKPSALTRNRRVQEDLWKFTERLLEVKGFKC